MVEKDSATLGLPGEQTVPMDADHNSICKFVSNDSPMCQIACGSIAAAIKRILLLNSERRQPLDQQTKAPAAGPATEHNLPEPPVAAASSSAEILPLFGVTVLYTPAAAAIVECV